MNSAPLTNVLNRRGFDEQSYSLIEEYKSYAPMCLLLIDIDKFKHINDEFGHDAGDKVLQHFSKTVHSMVRDQDIFARIGGDEFCILLVDKDIDAARNVTERIRASCSDERVRLSADLDIGYAISIGVSQRMPQENDITNWLKRTDKLLYKAKASGRDTVVFE
jgi:diguanylate cyclase (GGDEF)-like protein